MTPEKFTQLCDELDKLKYIMPAGSKFSSEWLEQEYVTVSRKRNYGTQTCYIELKILKNLIRERDTFLMKNKSKIKEFFPIGRIIRDIGIALDEIIKEEQMLKEAEKEFNKALFEEDSVEHSFKNITLDTNKSDNDRDEESEKLIDILLEKPL